MSAYGETRFLNGSDSTVLFCTHEFDVVEFRESAFLFFTVGLHSVIPFDQYLLHCFKEIQSSGDYLCEEDGKNEELTIGNEFIRRHAKVMSLVTTTSKHSTCFTKSYYSFVAGTGSFIVTANDRSVCLFIVAKRVT